MNQAKEHRTDERAHEAATKIQSTFKSFILRKKIASLQSEFRSKSAFAKYLHIIQEFHATEKKYVRFLRVLENEYRLPLLEKEKLASEDDCNVLFQNLPQILSLHEDLLDRIEKINFPLKTFVDADFLAFIQFLKIYTEYCNGHTTAVQLLQEKRKKKVFSKWCRERRKFSRGLEMDSLLIMPVQRIPRILLLFKELVKCTLGTSLEERITECHKVSILKGKTIHGEW